jgi:NAD(P)-dependent dehydrogenase (short-subunit alcohol dehydrogenase family)
MNPITSEKDKLGFVGVGYMGRPIAQRLLQSGFKVKAYDRHRSKTEELIRYGGTVAPSVAELSSSCDVMLSCLASDEAVLQVYGGADGAFANARRGAPVLGPAGPCAPHGDQLLPRASGAHRRLCAGSVARRARRSRAPQGAYRGLAIVTKSAGALGLLGVIAIETSRGTFERAGQ